MKIKFIIRITYTMGIILFIFIIINQYAFRQVINSRPLSVSRLEEWKWVVSKHSNTSHSFFKSGDYAYFSAVNNRFYIYARNDRSIPEIKFCGNYIIDNNNLYVSCSQFFNPNNKEKQTLVEFIFQFKVDGYTAVLQCTSEKSTHISNDTVVKVERMQNQLFSCLELRRSKLAESVSYTQKITSQGDSD